MNASSFPKQVLDRLQIQDCLARYARGVDRGDWELVRSTYHPDATDQHGEYRGGVDGLMVWLEARFAGVDNSMHFLGNCLIEFADAQWAFAETYFVSRRLRSPTPQEQMGLATGDMLCREAWGRYLDHFEKRDGIWRVARRMVVLEAASTSVALGGQRALSPSSAWGSRDAADLSHQWRKDLFEGVRPKG